MVQRSMQDNNPGVPILLYHRVSDEPVPGLEHYCVSPDAFRRQMAWLKVKRYEAISLDTLVDHHKVGTPLPPRPVIITFDDGYKDNLDNAYPVLRSFGLHAVIFLVAGMIGRRATWDSAFGVPPRLLSWPEIRTMVRGPIMFGAHTINHPHLCQLEPGNAKHEIEDAKAVLEDGLGLEVSFFAYPFSDLSEQLQGLVAEAGYRAACSSVWGLSTSADSIYALRRVIIGRADSLETFARKIGSPPRAGAGIVRPILHTAKRLVLRGHNALTGRTPLD